MIRIETPEGWWLMGHRDHARLAAAFGHHWSTKDFPAPEPRKEVLTAITHHDDAWVERDSEPELTPEGRPSAFTKELVGTYDAFEEIDFYAYLKVRGQATEAQADANPYAAMLISMHTESLLTNGADLSTLTEEERVAHGEFIAGQQKRQKELLAEAIKRDPSLEPYSTPETLRRAFEFLQACDSFSLITCVAFPTSIPLQHLHPDESGARHEIKVIPLGDNCYRLEPYPLDEEKISLTVPARFVPGNTFENVEAFRSAFSVAQEEKITITLTK
ncbi:DUF3891 family protein [Pelagicoccus albus]|uniref:DUF3891 family protein n=1 Tax=Pelagicoccus albus TaxID=415222 RepID=A0A7X1BBG3_9BACT|nr:DUF3891 family protein [Pelagicoccus albus]MBC2607963.1 DUF3891 family protein [Pelagicoccus albus]